MSSLPVCCIMPHYIALWKEDIYHHPYLTGKGRISLLSIWKLYLKWFDTLFGSKIKRKDILEFYNTDILISKRCLCLSDIQLIFIPLFPLHFSSQHYSGGWQDWVKHEQHKWSKDFGTEKIYFIYTDMGQIKGENNIVCFWGAGPSHAVRTASVLKKGWNIHSSKPNSLFFFTQWLYVQPGLDRVTSATVCGSPNFHTQTFSEPMCPADGGVCLVHKYFLTPFDNLF